MPPRASAERAPRRPLPDPATPLLSDTNARLAAARRLTTRRGRRDAGRFLAEGAQAVGAAVSVTGAVLELFATEEALERNRELLRGHAVSTISARSAAALSETVTPQGLVAVCRLPEPSVTEVVSRSPRLLVALVEPNEPGNVGAIVRVADAAGAEAVFVDGGADPYNGKAVRASAGSVFHLPVVAAATADLLAVTRAAGLVSLGATARGAHDVDALSADATLARPTVWVFGSEAHGLPDSVLDAVDLTVRVPIYGQAESLNLAVAAGVCLYASARQQHGATGAA